MVLDIVTATRPEARQASPLSWYAIWTNSHCEQLVHDQLLARGFEPFLPRMEIWSRRGGARRSSPLRCSRATSSCVIRR